MAQISQVVWSIDEDDRAGRPLLIALHGRGADESSMIGLAARLPAEAVIAAPRGPLPVEGGGWTWFENRGIGRPIQESIEASVVAVQEWLRPIRANFTSVWLLGFSAGAAMAGALLLSDPAEFDATVLLSGTLPWDAGFDTSPGRLADRRVLFASDPQDPVIPSELMQRSERWLTVDSGAALELHHYSGLGHATSDEELAAVARFLLR